MKRALSILLALALCLGIGAYASGDPSGGASGAGLPEELAGLPTVEAEPWVEVSDERVGLEGPAFDENGNLYVCSVGMNYPENYIVKIDPEKNITKVYEGELSPLGLAFHKDGRLFAVCREGTLLILDPDGTVLESVTPSYEDKTFSLNDLCFTAAGDLLVTDWQGSAANPIGGIYLLTAESGYAEALVVADKLAGPNGISLSPDGNTLWVGMTNELSVYRINLRYKSGRPTADSIEKIYENTGSGQPDSNKTDAEGNLYQAIIQGGRILVFSSDGVPIANVLCPDSSLRMTSNLAIKPGTSEGYMLASGFGAGSWVYTFETLAPAEGTEAEAASAEPSGEPSGAASAETQVWTAEQGAVSSYRPAPGASLAFVPRAQIDGKSARVDIYIDGVLYENVAVTNYAELLALLESSGLNGKKSVILTGVMEYGDFDGDSVKLYNAAAPNDSVLYIPDAGTEAALREAFGGLFYYGTAAGVDAYYTFDHGFGLYVDGYYAETAPGCAYYAISGDGLTVLDGPANAIYGQGAAANIVEAPYTLAVTERDETGAVTAVYYANTGLAPNTNVIRLGLDGNAAVKNALTDEYGKYLDYDFNGFTAAADITEPAIYLYTDALVYADGAQNTYAPVSVSAIEAQTAGRASGEFSNGEAVAYATNGGRVDVDYARVDDSYSVANCGVLGMLEAGSVSWGLSQESGYNAMVFATNGGIIELGDLNGPRSYLRGWGQIQNGVFATGAGMYRVEGEQDGATTSAGTAEAYVYNTDLWVSGWNGHVTDATRGGLVYIEDVEGYSGYPGSILGNGSGLTTDTGDGMVIAKDSHIEVFGMASGGMYIIGSNSTGVAINCNITSWLDGGAVSASGGHIIAIDSTITGKAGFRNRGGATGIANFTESTIIADNAYAGTVTMFEGTDHEKTIDFAYNKDLTEAERAQYVTNAVGDETLAVFELSLPDSIYRNTVWNTAATAMYDNVYCLAGANGYNGMWRYVDAFRAPYCWSNGESASYVTCFEFESSSMTLDLTNGHYDIRNTLYDDSDDTVVRDYDFLIVSEFGSNPTLNFIDHDDPVTGIIYNEGYTETHLNMGMPTKAESALTVNFQNSDFIGTFADGDLGFWETDVTYQDINGNETNKNGNYFCAVPNGKGNYSFDADSVWYIWSDSYCGTLVLADESCVKSYDGAPKTVYICNGLTIGGASYVEGDTVTVGNITFIVESSVFGQEPAPWTGEYTITANVVADDSAMAATTTVTVPASAAYGETFDITVDVPEGYGVAYVTACGKLLGAGEDVQCTASFSVELEGALDIEVAIAPIEGSDVWSYEDNGDGTVTITGTPKYTENLEYKYVIVPAELDGKPVTGFGNGGDNVLYRSGLTSITFSEGIGDFAYQALYDLNGCKIGILPASAGHVDEGFVRSMPAVTWGIHAASDAAQAFVDASQYAYEYINVWDAANIEAMNTSASGEASMGSGEPS